MTKYQEEQELPKIGQFETDIPLSIRQMIIIWFERVVLTFIFVTPIAFVLF